MNESMLKSFMQFIAGFSSLATDETNKITRKYVENYFERNLSKRIVKQSLIEFDSFFSEYKSKDIVNNILPSICTQINKEFTLKQKFYLLINLLNFLSLSPIDLVTKGKHGSRLNPFSALNLISKWLKLKDDDVENIKLFTAGQIHQIKDRKILLIVANENPSISDIKYYQCQGLKGYITFMYIKSADVLVFNYNGQSLLELNGKPLFSKQTYFFQSGVVISGKEISSIFYGEVIRAILHSQISDRIHISADQVNYSYPKTQQGVKNLSFSAESGEMIGILGGSGVGKSTIIKILSGTLKPNSGRVLINGYDLYNESKQIKGLSGVMHQEECLIEELSVFENLYYSAKLALGNLHESELLQKLENTLFEFDLFDCKDNLVGTPENRQLSGGQRKRLAIAMEIIRDPRILFADEPTSGLSSSDSLMVMRILKNIALEGKLVIVNIHQPSSEVYKLFDSILIVDKGGFPVFYGNPVEAILHFKRYTNRIDKDQSGCECCGNLKPEAIFELLEDRTVDEMGQKNTNRKIAPLEWHKHYIEKQSKEVDNIDKVPLPEVLYQTQNSLRQFNTFFSRNILAKIRNHQFLFFALALPPVLSIVIAVFLRFAIPSTSGEVEYTFYSNPNIPSFILMCILSSLFFGLVISCEDIIKERRIIIRETYIGLNLQCFYNSKLSTLLIFSAIQSIAFAIPGLLILEMKGITLALILIMFLLSLLGNLMGLILSSTLKSIVAIYILVPFLLIPQILFSGLVVRFDNLNTSIASSTNVPIVGELMASRWAVEAVNVKQFMKNSYNKNLFKYDFRESELRFRLLHLIPELNQKLTELHNNPNDLNDETLKLLLSGFKLLTLGQQLPSISVETFVDSKQLIDYLIDYLNSSRSAIAQAYTSAKFARDRNIESVFLSSEIGSQLMQSTRDIHHNRSIEELLRNRLFPTPLVEINGIYIQKSDPIYQISPSILGRSHFFAPYKHIGFVLIETYWYNVIILLSMISLFYFLFIINFLPKIFRH